MSIRLCGIWMAELHNGKWCFVGEIRARARSVYDVAPSKAIPMQCGWEQYSPSHVNNNHFCVEFLGATNAICKPLSYTRTMWFCWVAISVWVHHMENISALSGQYRYVDCLCDLLIGWLCTTNTVRQHRLHSIGGECIASTSLLFAMIFPSWQDFIGYVASPYQIPKS